MKEPLRDPSIVVRGDVPSEMVAYAREKLLAIAASLSTPVLDLVLRLDHYADPARERPNHVEVAIDVNGTLVRAHRSAPTMTEAIDRTLARLRRRIEAANERPRTRQLRHRDPESWHHGDRTTEPSDHLARPVEERQLVRRKTFALKPESIEEALFDLETLDHDFFLFVHDETGMEAVVCHSGDGYGLMQREETPKAIERVEIPMQPGPRPATMSVDRATSVLDETDAPFEFFVDAESGRGMVAYRRYDGNYGLIVAA